MGLSSVEIRQRRGRGWGDRCEGLLSEKRRPRLALTNSRNMFLPVGKGWSGDQRHLYAANGHPPIPPERLLRALLLRIFYSIRSERMLFCSASFNTRPTKFSAMACFSSLS
jgi:hypothetical protein